MFSWSESLLVTAAYIVLLLSLALLAFLHQGLLTATRVRPLSFGHWVLHNGQRTRTRTA